MRIAFFYCPKCFEWAHAKYSKTIKKYKCLKCGNEINFKKIKFTVYNMPNRDSLKNRILQELKEKNNTS